MIPKKYRKSNEFIASIPYSDVFEGTGYVEYNLYVTENSTSKLYILGTEEVYSKSIETITPSAVNVPVGDYVKVFDFDFDLSEFNYPKIVMGKALVDVNYRLDGTGGVVTSGFSYVKTYIKKYSNEIETNISSGQSSILSHTTSGVFGNHELFYIDIPRTSFKKGDILRVTMEIWVKSNYGTTWKGIIGTDPMNRDGTYIVPSSDTSGVTRTKTKIKIPYNINL